MGAVYWASRRYFAYPKLSLKYVIVHMRHGLTQYLNSNILNLRLKLRSSIGVAICSAVFVILSACSQSEIRDLSSTMPISKAIGNEYRVVADVYAYGIYGDLEKKEITNILLISGYSMTGREIAFKKKVERGQVIKIVGVEEWVGSFSSSIHYRVELPGVLFPANVSISIQLTNENLGVGTDLNPKIYEPVAK